MPEPPDSDREVLTSLPRSRPPDRVRITVTGDGRHDDADVLLHSRETPSLGGYGLQIVDRMADRWGTAGDNGEQIWFELLR